MKMTPQTLFEYILAIGLAVIILFGIGLFVMVALGIEFGDKE